jgi:two-component system cell cycle sensor histidine kinase/response regulator CckA
MAPGLWHNPWLPGPDGACCRPSGAGPMSTDIRDDDASPPVALERLRSRVVDLEARGSGPRGEAAPSRGDLSALTAPPEGGNAPRLEELIPLDEIQAMQDAFAEATGVASIITDVHGVPITRPSRFCRLCLEIIRGTPRGLANCMASDAALGRRAQGPIVRPCLSGGLLDGGASICVGDRHIASWLVGQVLDEGADPERLLDYAREIGADREAFRGALAEVTRMPRARFESVGRALFLFARALSRLADHNHQQARHIAERERSRKALEESEERYRNLFQSSGDAIVAVDQAGRFTDANPAALRLLGYAREELLELTYQRITPERWRTTDDDLLKEQVAQRGYSDEYEKEYLRKDGTPIPISIRAFVKRDPAGRHVGAWGIVRDMTERKRAEEALRESEERFRIAFHTSLDAISISRAEDGLFVAVNEGFSKMTGWGEGEVLARSSLDVGLWGDPADRAQLVTRLKEVGYVQDFESTWCRKGGQAFPVLISTQVIRLRGQQYLLSTTRDMSQSKRAEEERDRLRSKLHQAAKMEAIGQLAGGIAHDFNNLLTVILSGAEALRRDLKAGGVPDAEILDEIAAAGARGRDLTRQMLAFARRQVIAPVPMDLNALMSSCEKLVRRVLGEDVELAVSLAPDLWVVRCDPGQIEQALLNLAANARDAMPGGGTLSIETANAEVDERLTASRPWMRPGPYVRLSIRDTGLGMSPEVKAHLFEPFFTTKDVGKGTGLGLATVYGIMKQNEGYILVDSEVGQGTLFELYLPRVTEAAVEAAAPADAVAPTGSETVLLVEDDPQVRAVTVRCLRAGGYRVLEACDGREALDIAAREGSLHLLLTDVMMPGLDGHAVAGALRRDRPELRVLYVSGHAEEVIVKRGVLEAGIEFLAKPFTPSGLLARVRQVLDR